MAKKIIGYAELMQMAKKFGVENNSLFQAAARQYEIESWVIEMIRYEIDGTALVSDGFVSPLVKELPKHLDTVNKIIGQMLAIVDKLGTKPEPEEKKTKLSVFLEE